ncbi:MAG TPA: hypothetical protein VNH40_09800 [Gaiellaceae bacterium]|nr:hypothetical protein [Gaiellaceae bacterium]
MRTGGRLQLRPRHARLHVGREIGGADLEDPVHACQVEADPTRERDHMALDARARPEGNDRHAGLVRERENGCDLRSRLRVDDGIGAMRRVVAEVARVLIEHRLAVADAALVRDEL